MTLDSFNDSQISINNFAQIHNERVRKYFKRNPSDQSEEAKTRQYLASTLLINPAKSSKVDCIFECLRFELQIANALNGLANVYGMPMLQYQSQVEFQPQILLRFREREINKSDLPLRKYKLEKEISFRLFNEDVPKNNIQLRALANKVKSQFFAGGKAFNYTSGTSTGATVYRYRDESHGEHLN